MDEKMERKDEAKEAEDIREMDELFRRADFSADVPGLEARLWQRIRARISERELGEDDLEEMAAAGVTYFPRDGQKPGEPCK